MRIKKNDSVAWYDMPVRRLLDIVSGIDRYYGQGQEKQTEVFMGR